MKTFRILFTVAIASFACAGFVRAADEKPASDKAKCCAKAAADGKTCDHACCTDAAKAGKNCEKCGGKNEKKS
jgi:hypothetical protein